MESAIVIIETFVKDYLDIFFWVAQIFKMIAEQTELEKDLNEK